MPDLGKMQIKCFYTCSHHRSLWKIDQFPFSLLNNLWKPMYRVAFGSCKLILKEHQSKFRVSGIKYFQRNLDDDGGRYSSGAMMSHFSLEICKSGGLIKIQISVCESWWDWVIPKRILMLYLLHFAKLCNALADFLISCLVFISCQIRWDAGLMFCLMRMFFFSIIQVSITWSSSGILPFLLLIHWNKIKCNKWKTPNLAKWKLKKSDVKWRITEKKKKTDKLWNTDSNWKKFVEKLIKKFRAYTS